MTFKDFKSKMHTEKSSHLTACRTLLSRGFRLGSLVEERMPVPQLLARVFLMGQNKKEQQKWNHSNLFRSELLLPLILLQLLLL